MRVLLTGGSGLLGRALIATQPANVTLLSCPTHAELDVTDAVAFAEHVQQGGFDTVIHAAALTGIPRCEAERRKAFIVNALGARNAAYSGAHRVVYISTDYVFDGERGNYRESDVPTPVNWYAVTKYLGELFVTSAPSDHLIIRTSFCADDKWPYPRAPQDQWTSREPVSVVAPKIWRAALSSLIGTLHIGGPRRSVYEVARMVDPSVAPMSLSEIPFNLPRDTSLNTERFNRAFGRKRT